MTKTVRIAWRQLRSRIYGEPPKFEAEIRELVTSETGSWWVSRGRCGSALSRIHAVNRARTLAARRGFAVDETKLNWATKREPTQEEVEQVLRDFHGLQDPIPSCTPPAITPPVSMSLKALIEEARRGISDVKIEDFTCFACTAWKACRYAFDAYNTNGDCLAEK